MRVYIYQAALLCESCGQKVRRRRLREIKIPIKEFLYRVDPSDAAGWDDPDPKRRRWIRPIVREHWHISVGAKTMLPPDFDPHDETTYDSDFFPKGPFPEAGGESDSPQHCDHCGVFLENPLTTVGYQYVRECVWDRYFNPKRPQRVVHIWEKFYEIPNPKELLAERVHIELLNENDLATFKDCFVRLGRAE